MDRRYLFELLCHAFNQQGGNVWNPFDGWLPHSCCWPERLAAQDVRYNYDKSADFTKYKTYKWVDMKTSDKDEMIDKSNQFND